MNAEENLLFAITVLNMNDFARITVVYGGDYKQNIKLTSVVPYRDECGVLRCDRYYGSRL